MWQFRRMTAVFSSFILTLFSALAQTRCIHISSLSKCLLGAPVSQFMKATPTCSDTYDESNEISEVISQMESAVKDRARQLRSFTLFWAKHHWWPTAETAAVDYTWAANSQHRLRIDSMRLNIHYAPPPFFSTRKGQAHNSSSHIWEWSGWVITPKWCATIMKGTELQHTVALHLANHTSMHRAWFQRWKHGGPQWHVWDVI